MTTYLSSGTSPNWQPQYVHESSSYMHYRWDDAVGTPVQEVDCPSVLGSCDAAFSGSYAHKTVTMFLDAEREEVVSSACVKTDSTENNTSACTDGNLNMSLRVKTGPLALTKKSSAASGKPIINLDGMVVRYKWGTDKYWETVAGSREHFPVGTYTMEVTTQAHSECNPVPDNNALPVVVDTSPLPAIDWYFHGTACEWTLFNKTADAGGTIYTSDGQTCTIPPSGKCEFVFDFGGTVRFTGSGTGVKPYFSFIGQQCSTVGDDHTGCTFPNTTDSYINMSWVPDTGPPELTATQGPASPSAPVADKGATDVVVQQVHLAPTAGQPVVNTLSIHASGGHPDVDLAAVKVFTDVNFNGVFDGTDAIIGTATFDASGDATVTPTSTLTVASSTDLAIAVDINTTLAAGATLPGSPWSLLVVIAIPVVVLVRRRRQAAMLLALCFMVSCGGGGSDDTNDDDGGDDQHSDTDNTAGDDDQPVDSVVFTFSVTGATVATGTVTGFPLSGGSLSVAR